MHISSSLSISHHFRWYFRMPTYLVIQSYLIVSSYQVLTRGLKTGGGQAGCTHLPIYLPYRSGSKSEGEITRNKTSILGRLTAKSMGFKRPNSALSNQIRPNCPTWISNVLPIVSTCKPTNPGTNLASLGRHCWPASQGYRSIPMPSENAFGLA